MRQTNRETFQAEQCCEALHWIKKIMKIEFWSIEKNQKRIIL